MAKFVTALFKSRIAVEAAVKALFNRGYTRNEISILMPEATKTKEFVMEDGTRTTGGVGIGGLIGGAVGATAAAIAAIETTMVIQGLDIVIAGPIAAALAGAGAGGVIGGLIGGVIGARLPEHRAKVYNTSLKRGGILLGVETRSKETAKDLEKLFEDLGAVNTCKT